MNCKMQHFPSFPTCFEFIHMSKVPDGLYSASAVTAGKVSLGSLLDVRVPHGIDLRPHRLQTPQTHWTATYGLLVPRSLFLLLPMPIYSCSRSELQLPQQGQRCPALCCACVCECETLPPRLCCSDHTALSDDQSQLTPATWNVRKKGYALASATHACILTQTHIKALTLQ